MREKLTQPHTLRDTHKLRERETHTLRKTYTLRERHTWILRDEICQQLNDAGASENTHTSSQAHVQTRWISRQRILKGLVEHLIYSEV